MGNCQAAEAATVVIQHPGPGGRVERVYWSLTASQVMAANPGHYVAAIISSTSAPPPHRDNSSSFSTSCTTSTATATAASATVKHLKLLRPDDTLHIGHVYRLVSFEEVLREFATKKHVKLSRLIHAHKERGRGSRRATGRSGDGEHRGGGGRAAMPESSPAATAEAEAEAEEEEVQWIGSGISRRGRGGSGGAAARQGQWRPALQSISEVVGS